MTTPWGNTYTKDMAIAAIVNEELGKRDETDMIHIGFNATSQLAILLYHLVGGDAGCLPPAGPGYGASAGVS